MAILSDQEIWSLLEANRLKIDPPPASDAVQPSTIDLTLADRFIVPEAQGAVTALNFRDSTSAITALTQLSQEKVIPEGQAFRLPPGGFALAWTRESITLPNFLAARIEGRSTPARLGLSVHQSAPTVHPTWSGQLQLELTNAGPFPLDLHPGDTICQLILETMSLPSVKPLSTTHMAREG